MDQNAIIAHAEHTHERLSKAVRQFIDHSYTVNDVVSGRGLTTKSYTFGLTEQRAQRADKQQAELCRFKRSTRSKISTQ